MDTTEESVTSHGSRGGLEGELAKVGSYVDDTFYLKNKQKKKRQLMGY